MKTLFFVDLVHLATAQGKFPFIDNWGSSYEEGDDVVRSLYYQNREKVTTFMSSSKIHIKSMSIPI
jgi:hypothetical protein